MAYLKQQNKRNDHQWEFSYEKEEKNRAALSSKGKNVIVIGGGDTESDCIDTANRQGARSIINFELLAQPTVERPSNQPWPFFPRRLKTTSSHKEGARREWSINKKEFIADEEGQLKAVKTVKVLWKRELGGKNVFE